MQTYVILRVQREPFTNPDPTPERPRDLIATRFIPVFTDRGRLEVRAWDAQTAYTAARARLPYLGHALAVQEASTYDTTEARYRPRA